MTNKYGVMTLIIILCVGMLTVPVNTGFSKPRMATASYRNSIAADPGHTSKGLVLRSAAALIEDQKTGELLFQKQATAIVPIASITKLMTAMVTLDGRLDMNEMLTIEEADRDTIRNSHSHLFIGTHLINQLADSIHNIEILTFAVTADVICLACAAFFEHGANRGAVVFDKEPVAHIGAVTVNRKRLALERIENHERNQFFGKLKWPIVI